MPSSPLNENHNQPNSPHKRHVVKHDWSSIRAALWIAKHEHMSAVDECKGQDIRRQGSQGQPSKGATQNHETDADEDGRSTREGGFENNAQAKIFVDEESKKELRELGEDLAIVCPLIDGRMRDLAADK